MRSPSGPILTVADIRTDCERVSPLILPTPPNYTIKRTQLDVICKGCIAELVSGLGNLLEKMCIFLFYTHLFLKACTRLWRKATSSSLPQADITSNFSQASACAASAYDDHKDHKDVREIKTMGMEKWKLTLTLTMQMI